MKKLDFSNIKIIHKFKRANLVEAEQMLLHSINLNNLTLVYEINDLKKLTLLVKYGLYVSELTQKKVYGKKNDVSLLHNISAEKLNFLISHGLKLFDFYPLEHLHTPENFNIFIDYLSKEVDEPVHYFLENNSSTANFILHIIEKKQFQTINTIIPFITKPLFWRTGILKAIENCDIDSLYFLYKKNILNKDYISLTNPLEEIKNILKTNIKSAQAEISNYFNNQELYKKYGSTFISPGDYTLKEKKQKTINLTYSKRYVDINEQKLSKINEVWSDQEDFFIYFVEKERKELQQILNSQVSHNKKRL